MKIGGISVAPSLLRSQTPNNQQKIPTTYILPSSITLNSYASLRKISATTPISGSHHTHPMILMENGTATELSSRNGTIDGSLKQIMEEGNDTIQSTSSLCRSEILVDPTSAEIYERFKQVQVSEYFFITLSCFYGPIRPKELPNLSYSANS